MSNLQKFAQRADEAEQQIASLQQQLDYLTQHISTKKSLKNDIPSTDNNQDISKQIESLLLQTLNNTKSVNSLTFLSQNNFNANDLYGVLNSLEADNYIKLTKKSDQQLNVSEWGQEILNDGSPEIILYNFIKNNNGNIEMSKVTKNLNKQIYKVGLGYAKKNKWIKIDKGNMIIIKDGINDDIRDALSEINSKGLDNYKNKQMLKDLKKRKLIELKTIKYYIIEKGDNFNVERSKIIAEITVDDVKEYLDEKTGEWNGPPLKPYNFDALGVEPKIGELHPLMKMREEMRNILLDMGFEEMETNNYVESSFWNFDSLFQPQQHPARDAHDTFFLKQPSTAKINPIHMDYLKRVKETHQTGLHNNDNSIGWRYDWDENEARKNILRTHTTAVSARTLYKLANMKDGFKPAKCFSIDRVFRNETIDPTHLAEFHQVEGFIADYDLTLGHLIGVIGEFFRRIGLPKVQFKPAYNPYTEPSMEIFGWSQERQDWIEVGNSGVFRPEMLEPMGLPKNVRVIAWGLGLERPCMIATGVDDIRKLFGPKVDVKMVKSFPFVRYDTISNKIPENKNKKKSNKKNNNETKEDL